MNNMMANMYKKSSSLPPSRNPSAPASPLRISTPDAEGELYFIDKKGQTTEKLKSIGPVSPKTASPVAKLIRSFQSNPQVTSISLPSSPACMLGKEEWTNTESIPKQTTSTPFTLVSKERRLEALAKNQSDVLIMEAKDNLLAKKDAAEESQTESKQKLPKRKAREGSPEVGEIDSIMFDF